MKNFFFFFCSCFWKRLVFGKSLFVAQLKYNVLNLLVFIYSLILSYVMTYDNIF